MEYASAADTAKRWGVSERSVRNYCNQGRVAGAFLTGKTWNIPYDAMKPVRLNGRPTKEEPPLLRRLREEMTAKISGGLYHKLQIEFTYNSNHMEGSRLTQDQTRLIFETSTIGTDGSAVNLDDAIEAANHFRAINYVIEHAQDELSAELIKRLHRILKSGTADSRLGWFAVGDYKRMPNEVGGHATTPPEEVAGAMAMLLSEYASSDRTLDTLLNFHVKLERIHPFQDGNGRVGRLILLKECLASSIVPFVVRDDAKAFYYRGLVEWDNERGYLIDTCLAAQDQFKLWLDYFRIPYDE